MVLSLIKRAPGPKPMGGLHPPLERKFLAAASASEIATAEAVHALEISGAAEEGRDFEIGRRYRLGGDRGRLPKKALPFPDVGRLCLGPIYAPEAFQIALC